MSGEGAASSAQGGVGATAKPWVTLVPVAALLLPVPPEPRVGTNSWADIFRLPPPELTEADEPSWVAEGAAAAEVEGVAMLIGLLLGLRCCCCCCCCCCCWYPWDEKIGARPPKAPAAATVAALPLALVLALPARLGVADGAELAASPL